MAYNYEYPYTDVYRYNADWLINKVKEVSSKYDEFTTQIDKIQSEMDSLYSDYASFKNDVSKEVNDMKSSFQSLKDDIQKDLNAAIAEINKTFIAYKKEIDNDFIAYQEEVNKILNQETSKRNSAIQAAKNELRLEILEAEDKLNKRIDDIIKEGIPVYDPTIGTENSYCRALNNVFEALRVHALTVARYAALGLTCDQYANYELTVLEYAVNAQYHLEPKPAVVNPASGLWDSISNAAASAAVHDGREAMTVAAYDKMEWDVTSYDSYEFTTYSYLYGAN